MNFHIILSILAFSLAQKCLPFTQNYISLMKDLGMKNPFIFGYFNIKEAHQVFKLLNEDSQFVSFLTEIHALHNEIYFLMLTNLRFPHFSLPSRFLSKTWVRIVNLNDKISIKMTNDV